MLKTRTSYINLSQPDYIKSNENKLNKDSGNGINDGGINDKIANLSSTIKEISSKAGILNFKASLAFTELRKTFTKALILYHFDLQYHIQIKTNVLGYTINEVLS